MAWQITGQGQGLIQTVSQKSGTPASFGAGWHNELLITELLPRYAYMALAGVLFSVVANAQATPAAGYPLGAAGTPMVAIYNPPNSGKNLLVISGSVSVRAAGTVAAGTFGWSGGPTTVITAAASTYLNMLSLTNTGSVAKPYSATALTGSSALTAIRPLMSAGAGVTQSQFANVCVDEVAGAMVVIPGNVIAISAAVTGTADTTDSALVWAELPV